MTSKFITELEKRGLLQDHTVSIEELHEVFDENKNSVKFYIGFDPTADSLHIGSLQQLIIMNLAKSFGHQPIALIGGATASVGDPSFKDSMRPMMTSDTIDTNTNTIRDQITSIIDIKVVNNIDWTKDLNLLDFLKQYGKFFSVNKMIASSAMKDRLNREDSGLTVLEFSYSMLQGFDFLQLFRNNGVTVQCGGSDQKFNILQGIDLVHKVCGKKVIGITNPLVLKSDGTKMGKTVSGAVWLNKEKTSVFDFYQFWRNIDDIEVKELSKRFLGIEIDDSDINEHKKTLGLEMISFVHGHDERMIFEKQLIEGNACNTITLKKDEVTTLFDVLLNTSLFSSKSEIRRMIKNNEKFTVDNIQPSIEELELPIKSDTFYVTKGKKSKVNVKLV